MAHQLFEAGRGGNHVGERGVGVGDDVDVEEAGAEGMWRGVNSAAPSLAFVGEIFGGVEDDEVSRGQVRSAQFGGKPLGGDERVHGFGHA